jgi:hypothetical protein
VRACASCGILLPSSTYLSQFFKPIQLQSIIRTENLLTFCKPRSLPFAVRKTLGLKVYVVTISKTFVVVCCRISLVSFLQNKDDEVHPTKHSSMHSIVPYIRSNHRDVKCRSVSRSAPLLEKPKIL